MGKKHILSLLAFIICTLAIVITLFTNRNNTGYENTVSSQPTVILPLLKVKTDGVLVDNLAASDGQNLNIGSTVKTDATGSAEIDFPSGSVTRIAPNSEVVLQNFDANSNSASVKVTVGKIWSRVAKVFGKESFQTESNNLIASVRGTSYGHEVTADGHDIVIVTKSTVECDCKEKKPWQRFIEAGNGVNYDCVKNGAPTIFKLTAKDKNDEWYKFNEEEDAKLNDPWPSPTPTIKPTSTPVVTPTVTASPTPVPLTIGVISIECYPTTKLYGPGTDCGDRHTKFNIPGTGFDTNVNANIAIYAFDANGTQYIADPASTGYTTINSTNIIAHFSNYLQGTYFIKIIQNGQTVTSPNSVLVQ